MSKKKRDSAYWLGRLEREHPKIYDRFRSGELKSVREACAAAGLIHLPSRLDALKREWKKASSRERLDFVDWIVDSGFPISARSMPPISTWTDTDGYLTEEAIDRIHVVMRRLGWYGVLGFRTGPVMKAMGHKALDPRLGRALGKGWRPTDDFIDRLGKWLYAAESD